MLLHLHTKSVLFYLLGCGFRDNMSLMKNLQYIKQKLTFGFVFLTELISVDNLLDSFLIVEREQDFVKSRISLPLLTLHNR